jgi:Uma2 family endonuclease
VDPKPAPMAMPLTKPWTIEQLDRLPDDGNRYEVLDGELLVTPAPSDVHEAILEWLDSTLRPFVKANGLGSIQHRGVIQIAGSQLEPDLVIRPTAPLRGWANAPLPSLVVEVLSRSTCDRDLGKKREFYAANGIAEYWIVDHDDEVVLQIRGSEERRITSVLRWTPAGAPEGLGVDVAKMFADIRARG